MSLTTSTITGRVPLPTNQPALNAVVTFTLVGYDTQGMNAIPSGADATFALTAEAEIPVGSVLWQNTAGLRGTVYRMTATWFEPANMKAQKAYSFGYVQVGDEAEYTIADLLNASPPEAVPRSWWSSITQEQFDDVISAADDVNSALLGSPYQVVATDGVTGKAVAQDLGIYHILDIMAGPGDFEVYYVPGYPGEGKARGLMASRSLSMTGEGVIPLKNGDGTISSPTPIAPEHLTTKKYVDDMVLRASWFIAPNYAFTPGDIPLPAPISGQRSCIAFGYGSHSLHTNPGPSNNGGSLALGCYSYANGLHCLAVGTLAKAGPLLANGDPDPSATGFLFATALGNNSQATASHSEALGCRSKAGHFMSVALGTESVTSSENEVSVGNATVKRRITNAADPTGAQDVATKAYVDLALSPTQRAAINALSPIADPASATPQQVAVLLNSLIAALKA